MAVSFIFEAGRAGKLATGGSTVRRHRGRFSFIVRNRDLTGAGRFIAPALRRVPAGEITEDEQLDVV